MSEYAPQAPQPQAATAAASQVMPAQEPLKEDSYKEALQYQSIQRKLFIGAVDDPLENEADAMADKVMRMPEQPFVQRKCVDCEEDVHRKPLTKDISPFIQRKARKGGCNEKTHKWEYQYDGCSLPDSIPPELAIGVSFFFDKDNPAGGKDTQFANKKRTGPCDLHDECYQNRTSNREDCDNKMGIDMINVCANSSDFSHKALCFSWAVQYYAGLRLVGASFFNVRKKQLIDCYAGGYDKADNLQPESSQAVTTYASIVSTFQQKKEGNKDKRQNGMPTSVPTFADAVFAGQLDSPIPRQQDMSADGLKAQQTFNGVTIAGIKEIAPVISNEQKYTPLPLSIPTFRN